ncbi:MAG: AAA family ATPase [Magnetococcales bacterium]|nr:AAA family ATPase [Magnetococcales bacterium]
MSEKLNDMNDLFVESGGFHEVVKIRYEAAEQLHPDASNDEPPDAEPEPIDADTSRLDRIVRELFFQSCEDRRWPDFDPPQRKWIIPEVLPVGRVGGLIGAGGIGKSSLICLLAACIASGEPFFGRPIENSGPVLILAAEDEYEEIHRRLKKIIKSFPLGRQEQAWKNIYIHVFTGQNCLLTSTDPATREVFQTEFLDQLIDEASKIPDLRLIVIDPISRFRGGEENSNEHATRFIEALERLSVETGSAVLSCHHANKSSVAAGTGSQNAARGGSALVDGMRFCYNLEFADEKQAKDLGQPKDKGIIAFSNSKNNYSKKFETMYLRHGVNGLEQVTTANAGTQEIDPDTLAKIESIILSHASQEVRFTASKFTATFFGVQKSLGLTKADLDLFVKNAVSTGYLRTFKRHGAGGGELLYTIGESDPETAEKVF